MAQNTIPEELREQDPENEFETLGGGFAFPFKITEGGSAKVTIGKDNVKSCVFHISTYRRQELYGTPSFGSNIPALMFSVFSIDKLTLHESWMKEAIDVWEDRAVQVRVTAGKATNSTEDTKVLMLINYGIQSTGENEFIKFEVEE